eukprot:1158473-Pelagomonas_calceolata.AAC.11
MLLWNVPTVTKQHPNTHPHLVVRMVRVGGDEEVELDVVPLVGQNAVLKLRTCVVQRQGAAGGRMRQRDLRGSEAGSSGGQHEAESDSEGQSVRQCGVQSESRGTEHGRAEPETEAPRVEVRVGVEHKQGRQGPKERQCGQLVKCVLVWARCEAASVSAAGMKVGAAQCWD